jgi:hypothetical protein
MRFRDVAHASNDAPIRHRRELHDPEIREFWREIGKFPRRKRARQDSNLRPPA